MNTAKEEIKRMLDTLPDDTSLEDIQYHLYVRQKIERGLADFDRGNVLSEDEVEKRVDKWLEE
jgi:predicted transcriptional regulator